MAKAATATPARISGSWSGRQPFDSVHMWRHAAMPPTKATRGMAPSRRQARSRRLLRDRRRRPLRAGRDRQEGCETLPGTGAGDGQDSTDQAPDDETRKRSSRGGWLLDLGQAVVDVDGKAADRASASITSPVDRSTEPTSRAAVATTNRIARAVSHRPGSDPGRSHDPHAVTALRSSCRFQLRHGFGDQLQQLDNPWSPVRSEIRLQGHEARSGPRSSRTTRVARLRLSGVTPKSTSAR